MILRLVCKLLYGGGVTVYACCSAAFIWEHVADITVVSGRSMIPTFNVKQDEVLVITEHLSAQFRTIKKGDVVIARSPQDPNSLLCKRVAAMSGELIRIGMDGKDDFKIPKGHMWLLGDNPYDSTDSRDYGPIPYGLILGRVCFKVWPPSEFGKVRNPFSER